MSNYTLLDLVNLVLDEIDESQAIAADVDTPATSEIRRAKNYINLIYSDMINRRSYWSWNSFFGSFSTVAAQKAYTAANIGTNIDIGSIYYAQISNFPALQLLSFTEFKRKYGFFENNAAGQPIVCYVLGSNVCFYPVPDAVYTVNIGIAQVFVPLTTAASEPVIPNQFRKVLFDGALWMMMRHENDPFTSLQAQVYEQGIQKLMESEDGNHEGYQIIPEEETVESAINQFVLWQ